MAKMTGNDLKWPETMINLLRMVTKTPKWLIQTLTQTGVVFEGLSCVLPLVHKHYQHNIHYHDALQNHAVQGTSQRLSLYLEKQVIDVKLSFICLLFAGLFLRFS